MIILNFQNIQENLLIEKTCQVLKKGGLVVIPSDTVYGLAVDATNKSAVEKLIQFKKRPPGKPISVFVKDLDQAEELVIINKDQRMMLKKILPGPFTIVLTSKHKLTKELESEKGKLGIRLPNFNFINKLTREFNKPITATSANISGLSPHYSIETFLKTLSKEKMRLLDLIIDFGKLPRNKPSTVIDLSQGEFKILRVGDLNLRKVGWFISKSPNETKKIGQFLIKKYLNYTKDKPLIFLLEGEFGVGKTVFIKGIGKELGIFNIISPSFVIYYQYEIKNKLVTKLYHLDLYMLEETKELTQLKINQMLKPKVVICIEWGQKAGEIYDLLKARGKVIYIKMKYLSEKEREIEISN